VKHSREAFTLLELLVALAMASLLALSLFTAMNVTFRARRSATAAIEKSRAITIASEIISQDLQSVPPPTGILAGQFIGQRQAGANGGNNDALEFYTAENTGAADDNPMNDGIHKVDLLVRTDVNPPVLVRQVTRNLLSPNQPPPEEEILCRGVRNFTLQYYDGTSWQDDWDSTGSGDVLPMAVSITLELDNPDPTQNDGKPISVSRIIPLSCGKSVGAQQ